MKHDLLEVTTYPHTLYGIGPYAINEKRESDLICVKFYRTAQKPYSQTITFKWTEEHEDDKGNISIKSHMFCLKERAEE